MDFSLVRSQNESLKQRISQQEIDGVQKERIREVIEAMPDDVDVDALIEQLYLLRRLEEAEEEIAEGKLLDHDAVEQRLASWLK